MVSGKLKKEKAKKKFNYVFFVLINHLLHIIILCLKYL